MSEFEDRIRAMTVPRNSAYPRPWTTDTDPSQADVLIVGASSAKTFRVVDVGSHDQFLDALWNRNGQTCRAMYASATTKRSRTRPNLERLSRMLSAHGLTSLQTNVACASGRYDAEVSDEDRAHGSELFKAVVAHVPWKAMIVYGVGASEDFGHAFDVAMPPVPSPDSGPVWTTIQGRAVFVSPTIAFPRYRKTVWPYLERVVAVIAEGEEGTGLPAARPDFSPAARSAPTRRARENAVHSGAPETPEAFNASAANQRVWQRMHAIEKALGLKVYRRNKQASLDDGPEYQNTTRVFRHEFTTAKADILVREDVFLFDPGLKEAAAWKKHTNEVFQNLRTDDLQLLARILDAVEVFARARAP